MNTDKKHFVLTGPESTGKTSLFEQLKQDYSGVFIEEYSREYLALKESNYERIDLRKIAFKQFQSQLSAHNTQYDLIFSDTCLLTILIWDQFKYGQMDEFIQEWFSLQRVDLYLLCKPDLSWEPDSLRENEHDQEALYKLYKNKINEIGVAFVEIDGKGKSRYELTKLAIDEYI